MWLLHIVAVQGHGSWQTGLTLWVAVVLVGGGIAWLTGEWTRPDALLLDLALAAAGGALLNAATASLGTDLVALIFGIRLFWAVLGALVAVSLAHDWVQLRRRQVSGAEPLLTPTAGGFLFFVTWLSGWPSEPGLVEATYDHGLAIKLLPGRLYYQVRRGPFAISQSMPLLPGVVLETHGATLVLRSAPASGATALPPTSVQLVDVVPIEQLGRACKAVME